MPAYQNVVLAKGRLAGGVIVKKRFVKADGTDADTVVQVAADTDIAQGVAMFSVSAAEAAKGKEVSVHEMGIALVEASAAIAEGVEISADTSGKAKAAASGDRVHGVSHSASGADTDEIAVLLGLPGYVKG